MAKDKPSSHDGKTIKIHADFITVLQTKLKQMRTDLTSVRQGMNPYDTGGHYGTALNGLTVKGGGDNFAAGKQAATRVNTLGSAIDAKLQTLSTNLSKQEQNLSYVLLNAKDTELDNMSAADAATMLSNGTGTGGLPATGGKTP
jgi:hypothetical protein